MLEVGSGIGTLTYAACAIAEQLYGPSQRDFTLIALEHNPFCRGQLEKNLERFAGRYTLLQNADELPADAAPFDLVCMDGPQLTKVPLLSRRATIYVEGDMRERRQMLTTQLADRRISVANYRPLDRKKGYWLFQLEATPRERATMGARQTFEAAGHALARVARRYLGEKALRDLYSRLHDAERWFGPRN